MAFDSPVTQISVPLWDRRRALVVYAGAQGAPLAGNVFPPALIAPVVDVPQGIRFNKFDFSGLSQGPVSTLLHSNVLISIDVPYQDKRNCLTVFEGFRYSNPFYLSPDPLLGSYIENPLRSISSNNTGFVLPPMMPEPINPWPVNPTPWEVWNSRAITSRLDFGGYQLPPATPLPSLQQPGQIFFDIPPRGFYIERMRPNEYTWPGVSIDNLTTGSGGAGIHRRRHRRIK